MTIQNKSVQVYGGEGEESYKPKFRLELHCGDAHMRLTRTEEQHLIDIIEASLDTSNELKEFIEQYKKLDKPRNILLDIEIVNFKTETRKVIADFALMSVPCMNTQNNKIFFRFYGLKYGHDYTCPDCGSSGFTVTKEGIEDFCHCYKGRAERDKFLEEQGTVNE